MEDCVTDFEAASSTDWLSYGRGQQCTRIIRLSTVHAHRHSHTSTVVLELSLAVLSFTFNRDMAVT